MNPLHSIELGSALLRLARGAIAEKLGLEATVGEPAHPVLDAPGATFVTLTQSGELRGCIGSLEAHRCLGHDVRENAVAAAFRDPRFSPLKSEEFSCTKVEVSLLTAAEGIAFESEEDLLAILRPGVDGVILTQGHHRATFLPQVWDSLPDPRQFLAQLKRKAGLPGHFWSEDVALARYQVTKWWEA